VLPIYAITAFGENGEGSHHFAGTEENCLEAARLFFPDTWTIRQVRKVSYEECGSKGPLSARKVIRRLKEGQDARIAWDPDARYHPRNPRPVRGSSGLMNLRPKWQERLDEQYRQGIEALADKIFGLIYATDGQIRVSELAEFISHERNHNLEGNEAGEVNEAGVAAAEERYLDECADRIAKELGLIDESPQKTQEQPYDQEDDLN
jgi:hypothetical protein